MTAPSGRRLVLADPLLVDHFDGRRWRNRYRRAIINANRAQLGLEPLPKRTLLDRILGRDPHVPQD
jgi:hypothetical protein